jgi:hypothetical protein
LTGSGAQDDSGMIRGGPNTSNSKQQAQNQFKKLNHKINNAASNIFIPRTGIE